ncbi:MAG: hypothetical protein GQ531_04070 [Sulfurovum sp.]|nr:hypothetical protein [Sulfurovum sp.]
MLRLFLGFMTVLLLVSCTSKKEEALLQVYTDKINYHKHLQQTEKAILYDNNASAAILTASYLFAPTKDKNDSRPEVFIVAVQFDDAESQSIDFKASKVTEAQSEFILTLEGQKASKVKSLAKGDARLKDISFVTPWGKYYEVTFPHTAKKQFKLNFESKSYGKSTLSFAKVAKFVYTKKGF